MVYLSCSYSRILSVCMIFMRSSCFCFAVHSSGITDLSVHEQAPAKQWITIHITLCPSRIGRTTDGDFGSHYQGSGQGDSSNRNRFMSQFLLLWLWISTLTIIWRKILVKTFVSFDFTEMLWDMVESPDHSSCDSFVWYWAKEDVY